jgi:hypothetical protein
VCCRASSKAKKAAASAEGDVADYADTMSRHIRSGQGGKKRR